MALSTVNPNLITNGGSHKNLIINGGMVIDQRNSGVVTANTIGGYTLDRWTVHQTANGKFTVQQNSGSVASLADTGHANYFGVVSASAHSVTAGQQYLVRQFVEGFDFAHAGWGTSSAKTVTISFWVRSSLTGNHGGALQNSNATRVYPFSYVINVANTWEKKTITVAGDTTGTWIGATNGQGVKLCFSMGTGSTYSATAGAWNATQYVTSATGAVSIVGTSGATWYATGVQLELGSVATDFEHRSYGEELALCQRYYENGSMFRSGSMTPGTASVQTFGFITQKRATPTMTSTADSFINATSATIQNATSQDFRHYPSGGTTQHTRYMLTWTAEAEL